MEKNASQHEVSLIKASIVVFFTSFLFFYDFGIIHIFNALEPYVASEYQLSGFMVGLISSLYFWGNVAMLLPAGSILDRLSPRWVNAFAILVSAVAVACVAMSSNTTLLALSRLLMGLSGGFCFIGCIRIATNWLHSDHMAIAAGCIVTMGMIGGAMAQTPFVALIHHIGWRPALGVVAVIGFVMSICVMIFVRDVPKAFAGKREAQKEHLRQMGLWSGLKLAFSKKQNWLCGLYTSTMNVPIFLLGALWGGQYLTHVNHMTDSDASLAILAMFIGTVIGSPIAGFVSDKLGRRKLPMIVAALISLALSYVLIEVHTDAVAPEVALFFALGFITSAQIISYPTLAESNSRMITSTATSIISLLSLLGGALVQPLFGHLIDAGQGGNYEFAVKILPVAFVISIISALLIKETHCQRQVEN